MKKPQPNNVDEVSLDPNSVDDAAAVWSETMRESGQDLRTRQAFQNWRDRNRAHGLAFDRVEVARFLVESAADEPEMQALRNEALSRVMRRRMRWIPYAAGIAATVVAGVVGLILMSGAQWQDIGGRIHDGMRVTFKGERIYETAVGERLVATLADGSTVTLNTASRVVVAFEEHQRNIRLDRGQALFEVAKDASRPFVVAAGNRRVTALGTAFDVRVTDRMFEVTLLEGRVSVEPESIRVPAALLPASAVDTRAMQRAELVPGQQLVAMATKAPIVRKADIKRVTSWKNGQVIFENDPLGGAIEEMNRYARKRVTLADPQLANLKISGAFETGDTLVFVEALTQYFPIDIKTSSEEGMTLAWRE